MVVGENELYHYGVKGMRWGVRKAARADTRQAGKLRRHVAADKKIMKRYAKNANESMQEYTKAEKAHRKNMRRPGISRKKKQARIAESSKALNEIGKELTRNKADYVRAKKIYEKDEAKFKKQMDSMKKKYGSENIKSIKTKNVKYGKRFKQEVVKTGITAADLPVVGSVYIGRVYGKKESAHRRDVINNKALEEL